MKVQWAKFAIVLVRLSCLPALGTELARPCCRALYLRCLYHQKDTLAVVERFRGPRTLYHELG